MKDLTDRQKLAHEGARDTIKHLVTLTTASIGILLVIFKDLVGADARPPTSLWWTFAVFGVSSLAGLLALQSLTGNIETQESPSIYCGNVVVFVAAQVLGFVAGLVLAVATVAAS